MVFPAVIAHLNRRLINPLVSRLAGSTGSLGMLEHRGRRTGRLYRTPLVAFPAPGGFAIVLSYGEQADWLQNVLAQGTAMFTWRHRRFVLAHPVLEHGTPEGVSFPRWARVIMFLVQANTSLVMEAREQAAENPG